MIEPGERVGYSSSILKATGHGGCDSAWFRRGMVIATVDAEFSVVIWDDAPGVKVILRNVDLVTVWEVE